MVEAAPSGEQWLIKSGDHEAVIVEVGGGLRRYGVAGVDVVDGYAETEMCPDGAGQVLAPWPSRIRDGRYVFAGEQHQLPLSEPLRHNAIHGLVNWARWHTVDVGSDEVTVEHALAAQPGYPWPLRLRTTWSVGPTGLRASHEITNGGGAACPLGLAVHPYLTVPGVRLDDLMVQIPARYRLLVDGRLLPIGAARVAGSEFDFTKPRRLGAAAIDVAFGDLIREGDGSSAVTLSTVDGRGVRLWADAAFSWWQVYTSDSLTGQRRRRSIAVEPMTCPPDAFRSGRDVVVLESGQTWQGTWGIATM
jgi:aldose 1-epimerase